MANPNPNTTGIQPPPNPAEEGNERARTHGAYSKRDLGPLRVRAAEALREEYPWLSEAEVQFTASQEALFLSTQAVLEDMAHPHRVRGKDVDWQSIAAHNQKLAASLRRTRRELNQEARERGYKPGERESEGDDIRLLKYFTLSELEEYERALDEGNEARATAIATRVQARVADIGEASDATTKEHGQDALLRDPKLREMQHELLTLRASGRDRDAAEVLRDIHDYLDRKRRTGWVKDENGGYSRAEEQPREPIGEDRQLPPAPENHIWGLA